jgi:hypothetical protein
VVVTGPALTVSPGGSLAQATKAPTASFLGTTNPIYDQQNLHWKREEERLYGGDAVLQELVRFDYEAANGPHYTSRLSYATYINLPKLHSSLITGHVSKKRPKPGSGLSFGALGDVRTRGKIDSTPTRAELLYYNVDGIGQDASEYPVWWDGVFDRAEATGFRWVMVEVPRRDTLLSAEITMADELAGARPFFVEYSPRQVTNWWYHNGELQFAVVRPVVDEPYVNEIGNLYMPQLKQKGYYLMVRKGCELLGPEWSGGGWWLWNSGLAFLDSGDWSKTGGRIPMFPVFSEPDPGTPDHPQLARSQTMELGQAAVKLMNMTSARDFDAFDAASSKTFLLGANPDTMQVVKDALPNSQVIGIPNIQNEDGSSSQIAVYDGSQGAVAANVFKTLIESIFDEAERLMVERSTSSKDSSGAKQVAGFAEGTSPLLVRRARLRQQAETTAINFAELRWGATKNATGYAEYPDDYELAPLVDDIDAQFDTLRRSGASSPTLTVGLVMGSVDERGVLPENADRKKIEAELLDSLTKAQANAEARTALLASGVNPLTTPPKPGSAPPAATLPALPANTPPGGAPNPKAAAVKG